MSTQQQPKQWPFPAQPMPKPTEAQVKRWLGFGLKGK